MTTSPWKLLQQNLAAVTVALPGRKSESLFTSFWCFAFYFLASILFPPSDGACWRRARVSPARCWPGPWPEGGRLGWCLFYLKEGSWMRPRVGREESGGGSTEATFAAAF